MGCWRRKRRHCRPTASQPSGEASSAALSPANPPACSMNPPRADRRYLELLAYCGRRCRQHHERHAHTPHTTHQSGRVGELSAQRGDGGCSQVANGKTLSQASGQLQVCARGRRINALTFIGVRCFSMVGEPLRGPGRKYGTPVSGRQQQLVSRVGAVPDRAPVAALLHHPQPDDQAGRLEAPPPFADPDNVISDAPAPPQEDRQFAVYLFVHAKDSQKAGPFSVARLKMDLPLHNRLACTREVPALLSDPPAPNALVAKQNRKEGAVVE